MPKRSEYANWEKSNPTIVDGTKRSSSANRIVSISNSVGRRSSTSARTNPRDVLPA